MLSFTVTLSVLSDYSLPKQSKSTGVVIFEDFNELTESKFSSKYLVCVSGTMHVYDAHLYHNPLKQVWWQVSVRPV